jgi:K+/H+ antiporter YhaU regulatory subunit KhtT
MKNSINPPIYSQVAFDIAAKIAAGELRIGERFTGRSLMGAQYGVSPETIRRAMRHLEDMGIISTQANVGSTVLSQKRAVEYVEQYQAGRDLRALKMRLKELTAQRDALNSEIVETTRRIIDLGERFRYSDRLRTYEFEVGSNAPTAGQSIGELRFRQKTGATIVAVRKGEEILLSPGPQTLLEAGDVLVVACELSQLGQVSELLNCQPEGDPNRK